MGNVVSVLSALAKLKLDNPKFTGTYQSIGVGSATAATPPVPNFPAGSVDHTLKFSVTEAVTIGAPTGQLPTPFVSKLRIFITDLGAAAVGFNAVFKAAPINAGAGTSQRMYLEFIYDGAYWIQVGVTGTAGSAAENKWM